LWIIVIGKKKLMFRGEGHMEEALQYRYGSCTDSVLVLFDCP